MCEIEAPRRLCSTTVAWFLATLRYLRHREIEQVSVSGGQFIVDREDLETIERFGPWFRDLNSGEWRNNEGGFAADLILCPTCRRDKVVYRNGLNDLRREHLRLSECRPN